MSRRRLAGPIVVAAVALIALLALRPVSTARSLAIWLLLVAALALLTLARDVRSRDTSGSAPRFEAALRDRPRRSTIPIELARTERELELGIANADYAHRRLLRLLQAAAAARLASQHGVELARSPERAHALLGDEAWELLRPDRPAPLDRHGPGIPRAKVVALVEKVESL